ncbi:MAG: TatD family hydrolase [bacterium]|nr:TatD family hydrolase [bacterium]
MNLFDSHCHLEDERFAEDRAEVMARMEDAGVRRCILAGSDMDSSSRIVEMTRLHPHVYGVVGVHPHEAKTWTDECEARITQWVKEERIVGVGEFGLDYYYDLSPRETQREVFVKQLLLARKLDMPAVFHIRDAHGDILSLMKAHRNELPAGVIHCCSASVETAREYLDMGFYISFAGPVTFKNANKLLDVAQFVPDDRIMVETDSPYMAPVPMRGKRNEPTYVKYVAEKIAELRGIPAEEMAQLATANTCRLFRIPQEV